MRRRASAIATFLACSLLLPTPLPARMARPPYTVGPMWTDRPHCPTKVEILNGKTLGRAIPIAALRLGAPVRQSAKSLPSGGGTANHIILEEVRNGILYRLPEPFDPSSRTRPSVYAEDNPADGSPLVYQRLPLARAGKIDEGFGQVYAIATSPSTGRIAALVLSLPTRPAAKPRYRITNGSITSDCPVDTIDVYAPEMSARGVARLFERGRCSWNRIDGCRDRSQWPKGRVLFVKKSSYGTGYEHRWVDYDMLAEQRFGRAR